MKKLLATIVVAVCAAFTASAAKIDLSTVTANKTLANGDVAYGTLGANVKVSIAAGATVTISNAVINGVDNSNYNWAGITCNGSATIIVKGVNTVKGFYDVKPGIHVPWGSTLTILGDGRLTASSNGSGAGIGGGFDLDCGNIVISNATVTATGRDPSAGIGGGGFSACGSITIGGSATVTATGGAWAAGIGGGSQGSCGTVRIAGGTVTATATGSSTYASGIGCGDDGTCTRVEISNGITLVTATGGESGSPIYGSASDSISPDLVDTVSGNTRTLTGASFFDGDLATVTRNVAAQDGAVIHGTLSGNYKISIAAGATVMLANAAINGVNNSSCNWAGLTCNGDATIIVKGVNTVKGFYDGNPGIYVPQGSTLTILGDGRLTASNNGHAAGIGGGFDQACGNIVISNATVIATGRDTSAGIGGGGYSACGDITIGGRANVTATGGAWAAGIGGGSQGSCGTVRIASGTIAATGRNNASGIGCGDDGTCTRVEILNGITLVTATGGESGSPIYGSDSDRISPNLASAVSDNTRTLKWDGNLAGLLSDNTESVTATDGTTIYGHAGYAANVCIAPDATVTLDNAWNTYASGPKGKWAALTCLGNATIILSGENYMYAYHEDYPGIYVPEGCTLTIRGSGSLRAMGGGLVDEYNNVRGGGAGIGGGNAINCGNIVIEGGTITALGKSYAAGIGCGNGSSCGDITIRGGTVTATGSTQGGAGIGSAFALSTYSATCGDITIEGGTVNATGSTASAGIGAGNLGRCGNIAISGGTVTATGTGAGIGAGNQGRCGNITFTGGETTATSTDSASGSAGVGCGYQAICDAIAISGGILTATGAGTGAGIGTGGSSGTAHTGAITVSGSITRVVATRGEDCTNNPIGAGSSGGYTGTVIVQTGLSDKTVGQTRTIQWSGNLNGITFSPTAADGTVITGTRGYSCAQVSIAPGATVTLRDATLDATASSSGSVGLKCLGSATIILEGSNYVKGVMGYPGIYVPFKSTLTIKGSGKLSAYGGTSAAGIGSGYGGGDYEKCGQIKIDGGVIYAQGGGNAAGIGSGVGHGAYSDAIWIEKHVISVTAKSSTAGNPIGAGKEAMNASVNVYPGLDDDHGAPIRTITCWDGNLGTLTHGALALDGTVIHGTLGGQYGVSIADGATVTLSNAVINSCLDGEDDNYDWAGLTCNGDATIILKETNVVKGFYEDNPGIFVPFGHTLTITGDGSLTASSNGYGAGIGGGYERGCGNIVIAGGTITATGGNQGAAGIGGGYAHDSTTCGNITISGGTVTATGGRYAAGIGCGIETSCGDIDIRGGTVVVRGGENGAGIGGGYGSTCGSIAISRGTVDAWGGQYAAGIGCGYNENTTSCGFIIIRPDIVRVVARCGTGGQPLGAGKDTPSGHVSVYPTLDDDNGTTVRTITCWDGNLATLTHDALALDGTVLHGTLNGNYKITIAENATVTLSNATITCGQNNSTYNWAGLTCNSHATIVLKEANAVKGFYGEYPGIHVRKGHTLTILGDGSLTAFSNGSGAGIGGGYNLDCGNIVIEGGTINATGGQYAAGIGGGGYNSSSVCVTCGYITIGAGITSVVATGGSGTPIGAGSYGSCGTVTVDSSLSDDNGSPTRTITGAPPPQVWDGDLSTLTADATAEDGTVIHGMLAGNYKVSIAAGATVTLSNANVNANGSLNGTWAGLTCVGDATIILADGSVNTVYGFYDESNNYGDYPGIYVPVGSTLTIAGAGTLNAHGDGAGVRTCQAAGIGGGFEIPCGNIVIAGGTINAYGGSNSAGIGGGYHASCGTISITGGNVTAKNVQSAAGIGSGYNGSCGTITIGSGIVRVVAKSRRMEGQYGEPVGKCLYGTSVTVNVDPALTKTEEDTEENYLFYKVWTYEPAASGSYAAWATANGVSGAWNATDANGIVNVFRYAFNKPTGAFTEPVLLDITFNAAGKAVIVTPPLANSEGFTFTIGASDNVDGTGNAASYPLNASGETVIDETGKTRRFFRLRAVTQ